MIYTVMIEITENTEVEAESAEAAVGAVKTKIDPRVAASARFQVLKELVYNEELQTYTPSDYMTPTDLTA